VKRVEALAQIADLNEQHRRLVFGEFAREHAENFARHEPLYRPKTVEAIRLGQQVSAAELNELRGSPARLRAELEGLMAHEEIDLWVSPAAVGPAPKGIETTGDPNMNLPWTHAGMPVVTVPAGQSARPEGSRLPLGLQLTARYGADEALMARAAQVVARVPEPMDVDAF